jgi:hypothetical protein
MLDLNISNLQYYFYIYKKNIKKFFFLEKIDYSLEGDWVYTNDPPQESETWGTPIHLISIVYIITL